MGVLLHPVVYYGQNVQVAPLFGARQKKALSVEDRQRIDETLKAYETGLKDLASWDRREHRIPVFEKFDLDTLVRKARIFLETVEQADSDIPRPFMIAVAGGTASGKTTVCEYLTEKGFPKQGHATTGWKKKVHGPLVNHLSLDHYYKDFEKRRKAMGDTAFFHNTNVDTPRALTMAVARRHLKHLKEGKAVRTPDYDMHDSTRQNRASLKVPTPFFLVEGLFALADEGIRDLMEMSLYVGVDRKTQSERWWKRAASRGLTKESGKALHDNSMRRHDQNVEPTKKHADIVVDSRAELYQLNEAMRRLSQVLLQNFYPKTHRGNR